VPASGGSSQRVAFRDPQKGAARYFWPEILPGGKAVLVSPASGVAVLFLETGEERLLLPSAGNARFAATVSDLAGHVVFARGASLWALPFDVSRLQATGPPVQVLDGLKTEYRGSQHFALSQNGTLAYVPGAAGAGASASLVWVDRQGKVSPLGLPKRTFGNFRVSPDGKRVAVAIQGVTSDIWIHDLARGTLVRLTSENNNSSPVWTPDSRRIVFGSSKGGPASLYWMPADGSGEAEPLATGNRPDSISPDGHVLLYGEEQPGSGMDVGMVRLKSDRKPEPFLRTRFSEWGPAFSPDGRWVAYTSDESGQYEIYVRPYPGPGARVQVSTGGGEEPVWSAGGRELSYRIGTKWMAVPVQTAPEFTAGAARQLFEGPYLNIPGVSYDVAPDGRFLLIQPAEPEAEPTQINVVLNWFDELRRRAPGGKN
jgi:serine/threonine-protein kinase